MSDEIKSICGELRSGSHGQRHRIPECRGRRSSDIVGTEQARPVAAAALQEAICLSLSGYGFDAEDARRQKTAILDAFSLYRRVVPGFPERLCRLGIADEGILRELCEKASTGPAASLRTARGPE